MAVKFGSDGTLYCNTVKRKWKQARNLIADGCGLGSGYYTDMTGISLVGSVDESGSYSKFQFGTGFCMMSQPMTTPIAGHKYYGACLWKTPAGWSGGDTRFEWFIGDSDTKKITFFSKGNTGGVWQKLSGIGSMASVDSGSYILRNFATGSTGICQCTKMMIVDLTDTFGAGNEPSKDWCDNNIREWRTFVDYGTLLPTTTTSSTKLSAGGLTLHQHNYGSLDNVAWPRDFMYNIVTGTASECYLYSPALTLDDPSTFYYGYYEASLQSASIPSYDLYFPIAEPLLGSVPQVAESSYNGGGSMRNWKRISFGGKRTSFSAGSYQARFDFNNVGNQANIYTFGHAIVKAWDNIHAYNTKHGTSVTTNDINKEWCDCWIDNKGHPIIHIGDPTFKTPMFNTSYDVICNDIEIRPEVNKVTLLPNGKIICKKLVKTQTY